MKSVTLEGWEDQHGTVGLRIRGTTPADNMDAALSGDLIAHDLIEHVNGSGRIGMIDDEMEAMGALYAARGQYGWLRHDENGFNSVDTNIASDFSRMAIDIVCHGEDYYANRYNTRAHDFDCSFMSIQMEALEQYRKEVRHHEDADASRLGSYWDDCVHAMRTGARKLYRKWRDYDVAHKVFWHIADAVEPYCTDCYEGQRFILTYDRNGANVRQADDHEYF